MPKEIANSLGLHTLRPALSVYLWNQFSPIRLALPIYLVEEALSAARALINRDFTPKGKIRLHLQSPWAAVSPGHKLRRYKLCCEDRLMVSSTAAGNAAHEHFW